jgi:hypothetical protein
MALLTAALHQGATHMVATPALFYRTSELAPKTQAYPLEEINDYLCAFPKKPPGVHRTLAYYDLQALASRVTANTLLMAGPTGSMLDGEALTPLVRAFRGPVTVHESEQSNYKDGGYCLSNDPLIFFPIVFVVTRAIGGEAWTPVQNVRIRT